MISRKGILIFGMTLSVIMFVVLFVSSIFVEEPLKTIKQQQCMVIIGVWCVTLIVRWRNK